MAMTSGSISPSLSPAATTCSEDPTEDVDAASQSADATNLPTPSSQQLVPFNAGNDDNDDEMFAEADEMFNNVDETNQESDEK